MENKFSEAYKTHVIETYISFKDEPNKIILAYFTLLEDLIKKEFRTVKVSFYKVDSNIWLQLESGTIRYKTLDSFLETFFSRHISFFSEYSKFKEWETKANNSAI